MALQHSSPSTTDSELPGGRTATPSLSPQALDAISDVEEHLALLQKDSLNVNDFADLLCGVDFFSHDREDLVKQVFDELCNLNPSSSSSSTSEKSAIEDHEINKESFHALYRSSTYTELCGENKKMEISEALMGKVQQLFETIQADRSTEDEEEKKEDFQSVVIGNKKAIDDLHDLHDGGLEVVSEKILRYSRVTNNMPILNLNDFCYNPAHFSGDEFVARMEQSVKDHGVLNHHLIDSLSKGSYGDAKTVEVIATFLQSYAYFNVNFTSYLERCINLCAVKDPVSKDILLENMDEENGIYDDESLDDMANMGLDPEKLNGIPHKTLFKMCLQNILQKCPREMNKLSNEKLEWIASPLVQAFQEACLDSIESKAETSIAALYFASELIVNELYFKISQYLKIIPNGNAGSQGDTGVNQSLFSNQDLAFFHLHMDMDVKHAQYMRQIVVAHAGDEKSRKLMAASVHKILSARVTFYDRLIEAMFPPTGHSGVDTGTLYNRQSTNWVRTKATCLSDFTGRPIVFNMCAPYVKDGNVLDVGCGEGYGARKLVEMGARKLVGMDVSQEMIARAQQNPNSNSNVESYIVGDATQLVDTIRSKPAELGIMPGLMNKDGCFDLAVAIFLFNYTNIFDMNRICNQVFHLLKPGGHFVFSVPHPFMLNAHSEQGGTGKDENTAFSFAKGNVSTDKYFSLRGRKFSGVIRRVDGCPLNVKMDFKTISDYVEAVRNCGFEIGNMHEARVLPEHVSENMAFFNTVKDSPLHIVFEVSKPKDHSLKIEKIPRKISWSDFQKRNGERMLKLTLPDDAVHELKTLTNTLVSQGITADTFEPNDSYMKQLKKVTLFATTLRKRLVHTTGAALVDGLHLESYMEEGSRTLDELCKTRAKLAYYILCSLIGKVDGSARGRLFDVQNLGQSTADDNVLFSVSGDEAPWHTDGASADKSYDVASLLCLIQSREGGAFHLSNATNAFHQLKKTLPQFLFHELTRPLPRDVLENGHGQGVRSDDFGIHISRSPEFMKERARYNSYPIFKEDEIGQGLQIRYMRHWIETGHQKAQLPISPLLRLALSALDAALDQEEIFSQRLEPGQMVFCNNDLFVHSRDQFYDSPSPEFKQGARHMVRAWIQVQDLERFKKTL